jgi:hypothetical protein
LAAGGTRNPRFDTPLAAVKKAPPQTAVLILADQYPERTTTLDSTSLTLAQTKHLLMYIEYPDALPGVEIAPAKTAMWERIVVSATRFEPSLPQLHLMAAHSCQYLPITGGAKPDLVLARVAGYDTAVFGIPEKEIYPLLFEIPERRILVATTKLSGFFTGRFAPALDWLALWQQILFILDPGRQEPLKGAFVVKPAFTAAAKLPHGFQKQAFDQAANWFGHSHLLVNEWEAPALHAALAKNEDTVAPSRSQDPDGNGSLGILEGYASGILPDGNQRRRLPLRADCNTESAMVLGLDSLLNHRGKSATIASNLLDFVYFKSGMCQGARSDPGHSAYGLIGWGDVSPAWLVANYGDDNARTMLATAVTAAALKTDRWDEVLMREGDVVRTRRSVREALGEMLFRGLAAPREELPRSASAAAADCMTATGDDAAVGAQEEAGGVSARS